MKISRNIGILLSVGLGGGLLWRWASRHYLLPCPSWLAWSLENPELNRFLGTETTLNRIGLHSGQRVLEIGPGPGRLLIPAAKRVLPNGDVVGLDIQLVMIKHLKANAAKAKLSNLSTVLGNASDEHFAANTFDLVYLCTVLGEIPDREAALRQAYRILKPSGMLSVTEIFPDPHYQSQATVKRLAETVGFQHTETQGRWYFFTANFVKDAAESEE
jgi:ubiquinone/menaquinone biosynthesis C-methylase UbiE